MKEGDRQKGLIYILPNMLKIICYYGSKEIYRFPLLESVGHCLPACFYVRILTLDGNIMYNGTKGGFK